MFFEQLETGKMNVKNYLLFLSQAEFTSALVVSNKVNVRGLKCVENIV